MSPCSVSSSSSTKRRVTPTYVNAPRSEGNSKFRGWFHERPLGYHVSLLLVALRKRLAEFDARSGETRLVLGREELVDLVRVLLPASVNDAKFFDRMDGHINKIIELGFLRRLRGRDDQFEVQRILKAFVDAEWLSDFDQRLAEYREHATEVGQ